jgi:ADP-ribose pyrophosphatase YjhB (NUDIX family)
MAKTIIASGPVIIENKKVLLNKDHKDEFWKFPGGKIENIDNAGLIETAEREAKEELGIEIEILNPNPFILYLNKDDKDIILVHFLAKRIGEIKPGDDTKEWTWLDVNNLPDDIGQNIKPTLKHFGFIK